MENERRPHDERPSGTGGPPLLKQMTRASANGKRVDRGGFLRALRACAGRHAKPFGQATYKAKTLSIEAYCTKRYFTFSGHRFDSVPSTIEPCLDEIVAILNTIDAANSKAKGEAEQGGPKVDTSFMGKLHSQSTKRREQEELKESELAKDEPYGFGHSTEEPLNLEKVKAALGALTDEWLASEANWMKLCRVFANEAMKATKNIQDKTLIETMYTLLQERSEKCEEYDTPEHKEENRNRYDRLCKEYDEEFSSLRVRSLYYWGQRMWMG
jgi:hypothetical protein